MPPSKQQIIRYAREVARAQGIPESTFVALLAHESINFDPQVVAGRRLSPAGAIGVGQLMPGTARGLGVDPYNWRQNVQGSARYYAQQLQRFGRQDLALSAYNSGPGGSEARGKVENFRETRRYVERIGVLEKQYRDMGFSPKGEVGPVGQAAVQRDRAATSEMFDAKFPASSAYLDALKSAGAGGERLAHNVQNRPSLWVVPPQPPPAAQDPGQPFTPPASAGDPGGLNADFDSRLQAFFKASGGKVWLNSGYRSIAEQTVLWQNALKKYGSAAVARRYVAPPGKSNHNHGIAGDLGYANAQAKAWAHANAKKYGLHFPMSWEDWHVEPIGSRG